MNYGADDDDPEVVGPVGAPWYHRPPAVVAAGALGIASVAAIVIAVMQTANHANTRVGTFTPPPPTTTTTTSKRTTTTTTTISTAISETTSDTTPTTTTTPKRPRTTSTEEPTRTTKFTTPFRPTPSQHGPFPHN